MLTTPGGFLIKNWPKIPSKMAKMEAAKQLPYKNWSKKNQSPKRGNWPFWPKNNRPKACWKPLTPVKKQGDQTCPRELVPKFPKLTIFGQIMTKSERNWAHPVITEKVTSLVLFLTQNLSKMANFGHFGPQIKDSKPTLKKCRPIQFWP